MLFVWINFLLASWSFLVSSKPLHTSAFTSTSFIAGLESDHPTTKVPPNEFDPYRDNGGTIVGLAGADYCIIAADTRLSDGYMIRSRNICRLFEVEEGLVISGSCCWSDLTALTNELAYQCKKYEHLTRGNKMSASSLAHTLAMVLYSRRTFPYYSFTVMAGLDKSGVGALYRYDPLGSYERVRAVCAGKGEQLMQPMLDELTDANKDEEMWILKGEEDVTSLGSIGMSMSMSMSTSMSMSVPRSQPSLHHILTIDKEEAIKVIYNAFKAAAEREISVGDGLQVWVITKKKGTTGSQIEKRIFSLPKH